MTYCSPAIWEPIDTKSTWALCLYGKRESVVIIISNILFLTSTHISYAITKRISSELPMDECTNRLWREFNDRERSWSVSCIVLWICRVDPSVIVKRPARHPAPMSKTVSTKAGWLRAVWRNQTDMIFELRGKAICETYVLSNIGINDGSQKQPIRNQIPCGQILTVVKVDRSPCSRLCFAAMHGTPRTSLPAYFSIRQLEVHAYFLRFHLSPHLDNSDH
jgi:hypothetical protein